MDQMLTAMLLAMKGTRTLRSSSRRSSSSS